MAITPDTTPPVFRLAAVIAVPITIDTAAVPPGHPARLADGHACLPAKVTGKTRY